MPISETQRITAAAKVGSAVDYMACSSETLRGRLLGAFTYLVSLEVEDLPETQRAAYAEIRRRFTELTPRGQEGRVAATLARIRKPKLIKLATMLVALKNDLSTPLRTAGEP